MFGSRAQLRVVSGVLVQWRGVRVTDVESRVEENGRSLGGHTGHQLSPGRDLGSPDHTGIIIQSFPEVKAGYLSVTQHSPDKNS